MPAARELNRVLGLGLDEPATDELLDEVERFFEGITFFVQLAPGTQPPDLEARLAARGYVRDYAWAKFDRAGRGRAGAADRPAPRAGGP